MFHALIVCSLVSHKPREGELPCSLNRDQAPEVTWAVEMIVDWMLLDELLHLTGEGVGVWGPSIKLKGEATA